MSINRMLCPHFTCIVDDNYCLEVIVLRGKAQDVRRLADAPYKHERCEKRALTIAEADSGDAPEDHSHGDDNELSRAADHLHSARKNSRRSNRRRLKARDASLASREVRLRFSNEGENASVRRRTHDGVDAHGSNSCVPGVPDRREYPPGCLRPLSLRRQEDNNDQRYLADHRGHGSRGLRISFLRPIGPVDRLTGFGCGDRGLR